MTTTQRTATEELIGPGITCDKSIPPCANEATRCFHEQGGMYAEEYYFLCPEHAESYLARLA